MRGKTTEVLKRKTCRRRKAPGKIGRSKVVNIQGESPAKS